MNKDADKNEPTVVEPFNAATEHLQQIIGVPNKSVDLKSMPKPIRWFGYFFVGFIICALLTLVLIQLFY
ncbi:hypothetical protein [Cohnella endophytica]|nr:hypothetical protein [Cohnella endophytica]